MSTVKCGLGWKGPLKVIYAEVECRAMQDRDIAALRRQRVTKEFLGRFGLEGSSEMISIPCQEQGCFPLDQVRCV